MTSHDFFFGIGKNAVFFKWLTATENNIDRIRRACTAIPMETLFRTVDSFKRCLHLCRQANGENFKLLPGFISSVTKLMVKAV